MAIERPTAKIKVGDIFVAHYKDPINDYSIAFFYKVLSKTTSTVRIARLGLKCDWDKKNSNVYYATPSDRVAAQYNNPDKPVRVHSIHGHPSIKTPYYNYDAFLYDGQPVRCCFASR